MTTPDPLDTTQDRQDSMTTGSDTRVDADEVDKPQGQEVHRIIKMSDERGDFVVGEDGCTVFWPDGFARGAFNAWHLRLIADELDRRNRDWFDQVEAVALSDAAQAIRGGQP